MFLAPNGSTISATEQGDNVDVTSPFSTFTLRVTGITLFDASNVLYAFALFVRIRPMAVSTLVPLTNVPLSTLSVSDILEIVSVISSSLLREAVAESCGNLYNER